MIGSVSGQIVGLHSARVWRGILAALTVAAVAVPALNAFTSPDSLMHVPDYITPLPPSLIHNRRCRRAI